MNIIRKNQIPVETIQRSVVPFHMLVKPIGPVCNLACKYCYYPQGIQKPKRMSSDDLEVFVREYIKSQPKSAKEINFVWQGGEPLLAGIGFYREALKFQKKYCPRDVLISNSIQTNATLINEAWCELFKEHKFIIGVSFDGTAGINDNHRPDKKGNSSTNSFYKGLKKLFKNNIYFNVLVVVHDGLRGEEENVYNSLVSMGCQYIQFQPLMLQGDAIKENYLLTGKFWGEFMSKIYFLWKRNNDIGKVFIMNIENVYAQYFTSFSPTCVHSESCGANLVIEPEGAVYACDHLIEKKYKLGNFGGDESLSDMVEKSISMDFGLNKSKRYECQGCSVKIVCQGGCPSHINSENKNPLCEGYFDFFSKILEPLRKFERSSVGLELWRKTL